MTPARTGATVGWTGRHEVTTIPRLVGAHRALIRLAFLLPFLPGTPRQSAATVPSPSGWIPPEVVQAFADSLFTLPGRPPGLGTAAVQTSWYIPVLLVDFTDQPGVTPPGYFTQMIFDSTGSTSSGSVFDYYVWASGGRVRVRGEVVGWIHLPNPKNFYADNAWGVNAIGTPHNSYGCAFAAAALADSVVDFSRFDLDGDGYVDMLWVAHSGYGGEATQSRQNLWSITSRMNSGWRNGGSYQTNDPIPGSSQFIRVDRFSILPELSGVRADTPSEIGVYCHEFGHALGLPDLYDTRTLGGGAFVGPGNWSLMATGAWGGDSRTPESPTHPGAWPALFLGWSESFRPAADTLVTLTPLTSGGPVLELWLQGEAFTEHFLVENRQRLGFDRSLPGSGLIVYHVNEVIIGSGLSGNQVNPREFPGLLLVEADGRGDLMSGYNRGEAQDAFPGPLGRTELNDLTTPSTRSFSLAPTNVALREMRAVGENLRFVAQVQPAGWAPARAWSAPGYAPWLSYGSGSPAGVQDDGTVDVVWVDGRASPPRVYARRKWLGALWDVEEPVSGVVGAAREAALAVTGDGGRLVVWTDGRHGPGEIYLRAWLDGAWGAEQRVSDSASESHGPAVAVDPQGRVTVAWVDDDADSGSVKVSRFAIGGAPGPAEILTVTGARPLPPALAVDAAGTAYVAWPDYAGKTFASIYLRRAAAGGPWGPATGVSLGYGYDAFGVTLAVDGAGRLHATWQQARPGRSEVHYHRRIPLPGGGELVSPPDTVLEDRAESLQSPRIGAGPGGEAHLVFEALESSAFTVRYKRFSPVLGWDFASTRITDPGSGTALRPVPLADPQGRLTVLWQHFGGAGDVVAMERVRSTTGAPLVGVPSRPGPAPALRIGPNPLRAGAALEVRSADRPSAAAEVELLDLAGRRVGTARLDRDGRARVESAVTARWSSGVYFARMRGEQTRGVLFVVLR